MKKRCLLLVLSLTLLLLPVLPVHAQGLNTTYAGIGDDVIEIKSINDGYAFHIEGNRGNQHFAVKAYDSNGEYLELLVNTTESYKGTTLDPTLTTRILEINAEGSWKIELVPLYQLNSFSKGESMDGSGDLVVLVDNPGLTASIKGNAAEAHFAVWSFGSKGRDLLVNTTDVYSGKVMLRNKPFLFVIKAEGGWSITLN